uniref:Uncharacterized protein n=1 Tax=Aegilops tauschii TaxID=37682 RepID=M8AH49_AEGTA
MADRKKWLGVGTSTTVYGGFFQGEERGGFTLMRAEDGELGFFSVSGLTVLLWKRNTIICNGVPSWGIVRTVELDRLLSLDSEEHVTVHWFAKDNNLVFLRVGMSIVFTGQIEPLRFKKVFDTYQWRRYYPFESVYATGLDI